MIFKRSPKSLKESYFTGELRLGESPNSPLHRYTLFLISEQDIIKNLFSVCIYENDFKA